MIERKVIVISICLIVFLIVLYYIIKNSIKNNKDEVIDEDNEEEDNPTSYILSKFNFENPISFFDTYFWNLRPINIKKEDEDQIMMKGFLQPFTHLMYDSNTQWIGYFNDDMHLILKEEMHPDEIQIITNWFLLCYQMTNLELIQIQQN